MTVSSALSAMVQSNAQGNSQALAIAGQQASALDPVAASIQAAAGGFMKGMEFTMQRRAEAEKLQMLKEEAKFQQERFKFDVQKAQADQAHRTEVFKFERSRWETEAVARDVELEKAKLGIQRDRLALENEISLRPKQAALDLLTKNQEYRSAVLKYETELRAQEESAVADEFVAFSLQYARTPTARANAVPAYWDAIKDDPKKAAHFPAVLRKVREKAAAEVGPIFKQSAIYASQYHEALRNGDTELAKKYAAEHNNLVDKYNYIASPYSSMLSSMGEVGLTKIEPIQVNAGMTGTIGGSGFDLDAALNLKTVNPLTPEGDLPRPGTSFYNKVVEDKQRISAGTALAPLAAQERRLQDLKTAMFSTGRESDAYEIEKVQKRVQSYLKAGKTGMPVGIKDPLASIYAFDSGPSSEQPMKFLKDPTKEDVATLTAMLEAGDYAGANEFLDSKEFKK